MNNQLLNMKGKTILISAGGTGGHVYPALAVANRLMQSGARIAWLGTNAGIESRLVPEADIDLHTIFVQGLRGNGLKRLLKAPFTITSAVMQARSVIKMVQPDLFIGFGGFASGPGAAAAKICGIPVVIHEQNAAMGMTNKIVSRWAKRVLLAFPIDNRKGEVVGNPIRESITSIVKSSLSLSSDEPLKLLVVGGSLGAQAINEVVPFALLPLLPQLKVTHQTGATTYQKTLANYRTLGIEDKVSIVEYITDMDSAYADADLVIARSGALTVSEIASVGLPAIFVPLPHAVDNHQLLNAQFLTQHDAAIIIEQKDLTCEHLQSCIVSLLDRKRLNDMASKAKAQSHEQALSTITTIVAEVLYVNA